MKKVYFLFVFVLFTLFLAPKITNATVIFNQAPSDLTGQTLSAPILNSGYLTSFTCTAGLECGVSGQTVYNVGIWIKKVGNPDDIRLAVGSTRDDIDFASSTLSNVVPSSSISDTEYTLKWFYFPQGVVIGNRFEYTQFFFPQYANSLNIDRTTDYYRVLKSNVNDYSAQQQWCRRFDGCYSSVFFWQMDDSNIDLSTTTPPTCTLNCSSSVMFFPGVMGSKLYDSNGELWVSRSDAEQAKLLLDSGGKSVNDVFTKDDTQNISDEGETGLVDEAFGSNIYNTFINNLRDWKADGTVSDYAFIPYDWRLSLDNIVTNGASTTAGALSYSSNQNFSESFILKKLEELQKNSESGKVTLIGHSNGGLVIKALVQKLKDTNSPLYDKIDKIILVAVPQVGTPDAVASLLHGTSLGKGFVMRNERLRDLAKNMPTMYNLLPSNGYFSLIDPNVSNDKLVSFQNDPAFSAQLNQYGVYVSNSNELKNYILGTDGRSSPSYSDTDKPSIGNSVLYDNAETAHNILDNWLPASTTKVIQVAGWGSETISGISYKKCYDHSIEGYHKCPKINNVVDGDGTVLVPSALWMSASNPNVERWWVNLKRDNTLSSIKREHRDITEVDNLNDFIKSEIKNEAWDDSENIVVSNTSSLISSGSYLHYTLHSPLSLGVYDNLGRYTGLDLVTGGVKEEIPDSKYVVIGDTQFVSIPENTIGQVKLHGISDGSFTLDIERQTGNTIVDSVSIGGVPSLAQTVASLDINPNLASTTLNIDNNGDGVYEKQISTNGKSEVVYDEVAPEISITYSTTTKRIIFDGVDQNLLNTVVSTSTVTAYDEQGNKTVLYFSAPKNEKGESKIVLKKISRNGKEESLKNAEVKFEMSLKKNGVITEFESEVETSGREIFSLKYEQEKGVTKIKEKTATGTVSTVRPGLVIERVLVTGAGLRFEY
jgi:Lecithin:cholesterol acyltransferase